MKKLIITQLLLLVILVSVSQSYTSYFTGNNIDVSVEPLGGICLMGGATENDEAMKWFLQRSNGGDILVLRASGSDGYNNYLYSELGIDVNSVETIVFNNASSSSEGYIHQKIKQAEGIWFAGGDQWKYVSYWRNTPVQSLIQKAIDERSVVVGGTSAGMAILGEYYFSAKNGTVTSNTALSNPYDSKVQVDSANFINCNYLENTITDTHYDNPNRKGRHVAFMARMAKDYGVNAKGIACDEYTAVCINEQGMATVFGNYPSNNDNAYFIQINCAVNSIYPENCQSEQSLTWNLNGMALKVYKVTGTPFGNHTFYLHNWKLGLGGIWEDWYIINGTLHETSGQRLKCPCEWCD